MLFKLFRKQVDSPLRFEQDASMSEALERRVNAIEFQPSRGFLKDQRQPKRRATLHAEARKDKGGSTSARPNAETSGRNEQQVQGDRRSV